LTANDQVRLNDLIATDWSLGIETKDPRMEPGQTFNTVASIYDAQRSGYPEALFDDLLRISRLRPGDRVLEVGCGTGQATAGFAARGLGVVAIDPGDRLLDIARPKFDQFPNVQFEISSFEDWPLGERSFHLVAAAQSWHWVRPEVGFEKASRALSPGGHLAIFGHTPRWSPEIVDALQPVYVRFAPEIWGPPAENWYLPEGPISHLVAASGRFEQVAHRNYTWLRQYSSKSFAAYLGTRSDHLRLMKDRREALLSAVELALPNEVNAGWETNLYVALVRKRRR
jgi:ubiquinone/menaquinone biosynthesis C-methylase UbiE